MSRKAINRVIVVNLIGVTAVGFEAEVQLWLRWQLFVSRCESSIGCGTDHGPMQDGHPSHRQATVKTNPPIRHRHASSTSLLLHAARAISTPSIRPWDPVCSPFTSSVGDGEAFLPLPPSHAVRDFHEATRRGRRATGCGCSGGGGAGPAPVRASASISPPRPLG